MKIDAKTKMRKITQTALLLSVSFCISVFETFVPINSIIPLPGLKLGFANIATTTAFFLCGKTSAISIIILKPILSFFIFGNITSSLLSFSGGIFSFAILACIYKSLNKKLSFRGISSICAVFHATGQIFAASLLMYDFSVFTYLPALSLASSITGFLNGILMNLIIPIILKYSGEK